MKTSHENRHAKEVIISADSHVIESPDLWTARVPSSHRDQLPSFSERRSGDAYQRHPGGHDPYERIKEMAVDGVSAEVLYPSLCLWLFALEDTGFQETCLKIYNDWLIDYCKVAPDRLVGIPAISVYNIDHAVQELERCRKAGLKGGLIWQVPHPDLPFNSSHYDRFWAAAQDLSAPISLHTIGGRKWESNRHSQNRKGESYGRSVNRKLMDAVDALYEMIFSGILERFPKLNIVIVENEIGWIPFVLHQWDEYYRRFHKDDPPPIRMKPSDYFTRQIYATFIKDPAGGHNLEWWGADNCMWSNDYPHSTSTWPNSRDIIERDLGRLTPESRIKLLCTNVAKLYDMEVPQPVQT